MDCSESSWKLLATLSIRLFPLHFSTRASPCAIRFRFHSTKQLAKSRTAIKRTDSHTVCLLTTSSMDLIKRNKYEGMAGNSTKHSIRIKEEKLFYWNENTAFNITSLWGTLTPWRTQIIRAIYFYGKIEFRKSMSTAPTHTETTPHGPLLCIQKYPHALSTVQTSLSKKINIPYVIPLLSILWLSFEVALRTFLITRREIKVTVALYTVEECGRLTLSALHELL